VLTVVTRRLFVLLALLAAGGCALDKQNAPGLTGPSELGLSIRLTASPDVVSWDGVSQSVIEVTATDANGQPVRGLSMRIETAEGGAIGDIGTLSARTISTNNDGRATVTFTAPPAPPPTTGNDALINIVVTPIGTDYQNTTPRTVGLRLARPGVIMPPNGGAPTADFFFSPSTPAEGVSIQFDASTSRDDGQIVSYAWTFGDGDTGTGVRPRKDYETAGTYTVSLTVTDDRGATGTVAKQVIVTASLNPVAEFVFSPTDPVAGQAVNVNAALSKAAPGRRIVEFEWNFGDGSDIQRGETASHVYDQPGNYVITLRVTDDLDRTGASTQDLSVRTSGPTASFTVTPASPTAGVPATFNASGSSALQGRTITSFEWDFGDGTKGSNVTVTKTYAAPGTYTVTLLVTDSAGQTGTVSRTVTIIP
jgi:PKD repeat protein